MKGFETPTIHGKMSLRASPTGEIVLNEVRVPKANVLPGAVGLKGPLGCLTPGALRHRVGRARRRALLLRDGGVATPASACSSTSPIASKQLVQEQLVEMAMEIAKGQIMALHYARLKDAAGISPVQVSLCKKNNVGGPSRSRARRAGSSAATGSSSITR